MPIATLIGLVSAFQQTATQEPVTELPPNLMVSIRETNLKYDDIPGFIGFKFKIGSSTRNHTVYIRKKNETYRSLNVHEMFGNVYESKTEPTGDQLLKIFSTRFSYGGLVYEQPSASQPNYRVRFRTVISGDIATANLRKLLDLCATTADSIEKDLTSKDVF